MRKIHFESPRVQHGRLRVFDSAEEAKAWEWENAGRGTICLVAGDDPVLRWYFQPGRCYGASRTPSLPPNELCSALRRLLSRYGTGFYNGICQGYLQGFSPKRLPFLVSTICAMTGARP